VFRTEIFQFTDVLVQHQIIECHIWYD